MGSSLEELAESAELYREGLREWLAEGHADEWRDIRYSTALESLKNNSRLVRLLFETKWGRYGWPTAAGGLGGTEQHLAILFDELSRRGLPVPEQYAVLQVLGPPIVHFAPDLAEQYLEPFLRGDEWWGQGFSESEAGSDMASLRTRAVRDGDNFVINGTKLWTSHGVGASKIVVLARTGTQESRHRGLSMFLVDTDTPGVEVRPIALANGLEELAEVFFEDVSIPADRMIGEENAGWGVAMHLMQYERGLWAWLRSTVLMHEIDQLATQVEENERAAQVVGDLYIDVASLRARAAGNVRKLAAGETIGPEASSDKLMLGIAETSLLDAARELLGEQFVFGDSRASRYWRDEWWWSRTTTIYGGAAEVQRQILADKVLNLPKEGSK